MGVTGVAIERRGPARVRAPLRRRRRRTSGSTGSPASPSTRRTRPTPRSSTSTGPRAAGRAGPLRGRLLPPPAGRPGARQRPPAVRGRQPRAARPRRATSTARRPPTPTEAIDPGDGFLMRHGWTVAWCGWQWDVLPRPGAAGLEAPQALDADGRPIRGRPSSSSSRTTAQPDQLLANRVHRPYPAADLDDPAATLTVRDWPGGPRTTIPRDALALRPRRGRPAGRRRRARLAGGRLRAGQDLRGRLSDARSARSSGRGCWRCATSRRSCATPTPRPATRAPGGSARAYAYGVSQSGRFLRHFLYAGPQPGRGRAARSSTGCCRRWRARGAASSTTASPSRPTRRRRASATCCRSPTTTRPIRSPAAGGCSPPARARRRAEGHRRQHLGRVLARRRLAGPHRPGRRARPGAAGRGARLHCRRHAARPRRAAAGARQRRRRGARRARLQRASTTRRCCAPRWSTWTAGSSDGVEPPPSAVPRLADGTAARRRRGARRLPRHPRASTVPDPERTCRRLRGPTSGRTAERGRRALPGPSRRALPDLRLGGGRRRQRGRRRPPAGRGRAACATYTGWNPRHPETGGAGQIIPMQGSTLPFAPHPRRARAAGDPRPSIAERYRDRADYLARARRRRRRPGPAGLPAGRGPRPGWSGPPWSATTPSPGARPAATSGGVTGARCRPPGAHRGPTGTAPGRPHPDHRRGAPPARGSW